MGKDGVAAICEYASSGDVLVVILDTVGARGRPMCTPLLPLQSRSTKGFSITVGFLPTHMMAVVLGGRAGFEIRKRTIDESQLGIQSEAAELKRAAIFGNRGLGRRQAKKPRDAWTLGDKVEHPFTS